MLTTGTSLPDFALPDESGTFVTPSTLRGNWAVLYFYPKDDTPGCTTEACSFQETYADFQKEGVLVYGISKDSAKSHSAFKAKFGLTFPLLVDADQQATNAFDVWVEKSMYGRTYMGIERSTYVVNPEGVIVGAYQKVTPKDHAKLILKEIKKLQAA